MGERLRRNVFFSGVTKHISLSLIGSLYSVVTPVCNNEQGIQPVAFTVSDSHKGFYMWLRLINSIFIPNQIMKSGCIAGNVFLLFLEDPQMKK